MREGLRWASSITQPLKEMKKQAQELFKDFKSVDFSLIEALVKNLDEDSQEDLWILETLPLKDKQQALEFLSKLDDKATHGEMIMNFLQ